MVNIFEVRNYIQQLTDVVRALLNQFVIKHLVLILDTITGYE